MYVAKSTAPEAGRNLGRHLLRVAVACAALVSAIGCRQFNTFSVVHGTVLASACTDNGTGTGWAAGYSMAVIDAYGFIGGEFSKTGYGSEDVRRATVTMVRFWGERHGLNLVSAGGPFYQWSAGDRWGLGTGGGAGPGFFGRRGIAAIVVGASFWLGGDGGDFDCGAEASLRLMAGAVF